MRKILLALLMLPSLVCAGQKYSHNDSLIEDEFANNYHEHSFPNIVYGRASTMTVTYLNVSSITLNGASLVGGGPTLTANQTWSGNNTFTGTFTASTGTINSFMVVGTATNDNGPAGRIGEYISASTNDTSWPATSGQGGDAASISLTPGDWDVTANAAIERTASTTLTDFIVWTSTVTGNDFFSLTVGNNGGRLNNAWGTTWGDLTSTVPKIRYSLSTTKTVYLKVSATWTTGTPLVTGIIIARRVR